MQKLYVLSHGFGFDHNYWGSLIPLLDSDYIFFDKINTIDKNVNYVGIGHSVGFQKLNNSHIPFKALIGLQGFIDFCANDAERIAVLNQVESLLQSSSIEKFLPFFYKACGYVGEVDAKYDKNDLLQDINEMRTSYKYCDVPGLILYSHDDKIVSYDVINNNFSKEQNVDIRCLDNCSHSMGYVNAAMCAQQINMFLRNI